MVPRTPTTDVASGIRATRNMALVIVAMGAAAWIVGLEGLRSMDAGGGANIGAGIAILAGRGLVVVGAIAAVVCALITALRP